MSKVEIIYPVLAHMFLVVFLFIPLIVRKSKAVKNKAVDLKETALNNQAWTPDVKKVSNNIANQFEIPILFYALCIVIAITDNVGMFNVILAWGYVALRYVHTYVHIGSNFVPLRMRIFALSLAIILVMLIQLSVQLLP